MTSWWRRPLTASQLDYAEADVTHLRGVYRHLKDSLAQAGRTDWVAEEMKVLTSENTYHTEPDEAWQRLKMRVKKPRELIILKEVAAWREREAQGRDVPRSRVIKDDCIYEVATQAPTTAEALGQLRTIPKGWERSRSGEEILAAVRHALDTPKEDWPKLPRHRQLPEGTGAAVDLMKVLLKLVSEAEGVAAKVIATTDDLEDIAASDEADVPAMHGWRREMFGEQALKLKRGHLAITFDGKKIIAIER
ncbi:MAG: rnd 1 [Proteobacteria bacterium]|nr:rnd 1 [Pseudomonadota bacterium]